MSNENKISQSSERFARRFFHHEDDLSDRDIKIYDFKHPKLVSKENLRALHNIHEMLSLNLNRVFNDSIGEKIEVVFRQIHEVIYSEFMSSMESPTALFLFNLAEIDDWSLMQMDPTFCLYCVERQGGSREYSSHENRMLTLIEERIMSRLVEKIFKELSHVWEPYLSLTIRNHIYESKPANIRTLSSHIPGIVIRYGIKFQDKSVPLTICYPYSLLKEKMTQSIYGPDRSGNKGELSVSEKKIFHESLKKAPVDVNVILGESDISMKKLADLEKGYVIKLNQSIEQPLQIKINGKKKMEGYPGVMGGKKAVKIFKVMNSLKTNEDQ